MQGNDTNPSPTPLGPRETIKLWNFEGKTLDEVLPWYQATTPDQIQMARATAAEAISEAKLQKAVRIKWGHDAETTIAHMCLTDTQEDDDAATVTVTGNHAVMKYSIPGIMPLLLIRSGGAWRVDIPAYMMGVGDQFQRSLQYCGQVAAIYEKFAGAVSAGKYQSAQEVEDDLKKETDALEAGQ